jgi:predicted DNA repair protein MutK
MTVCVYGFVAAIVKLDDAGLRLIKRPSYSPLTRIKHKIGRFLLWLAPKLMKFLSVAGTAAMFLVGGGILTHNVPVLHHLVQSLAQSLPPAPWLLAGVINAVFGILLGLVVVALVALYSKLFGNKPV